MISNISWGFINIFIMTETDFHSRVKHFETDFSNALIIHRVKTKKNHNHEGGLDTRS